MESEQSASPDCLRHVQFASSGPSLLGRPSDEVKSHASGVDLERIVPFVQSLKSSPPELRVARSASLLQCFGRLLRQPNYKYSFVAAELDQYWSHSWPDRSWKKVVVLLWLHNGVTAMVCGTFAAVGVIPLFVLGILAPLPRLHGGATCCTSLSAGLLIFTAVLLLGRPRRKVFVDVVCINHADDEAKRDGMLNIGAAQKSARSMLVLWDPSYAEQLWPVYEMANFLRSHEGEKIHLDIRPTILAPFFLLNLLGNTFAAYVRVFVSFDQDWIYFLVAACFTPYILTCGLILLCYFASVQDLRAQLNFFSVDDACCNGPSTAQKFEREVMSDCIITWFGSQENFERYVSSRVSRAFSQRLGNFLCQYWMVVVLAAPVFWGHLDLIALHLHASDHLAASLEFVVAMTWWLAIIPAAYVLFIALIAKGQRRQKRRTGLGQKVCWRLIPSCALMLVLGVAGLYQVFCTRYITSQELGVGLFGGTLILPCYLIWRASTKNTAMFSQGDEGRRG